jgi:hypothetical protein
MYQSSAIGMFAQEDGRRLGIDREYVIFTTTDLLVALR